RDAALSRRDERRRLAVVDGGGWISLDAGHRAGRARARDGRTRREAPVKKPTDIGLNRTGIGTSPIDSKEMIEGARQGTPDPAFDTSPLEAVRDAYAEGAEPVG